MVSQPTGREYLRVSRDKSGRQRSPQEQHDDNQRHAEQRGVTLGTPYAENGAVSASRYGRKARSGFAALVADLRAGRFGADELWLWESSRGSRKVSEWVELVEALEGAGVKVYVTTHSRCYDPGNPRDRRSLLEDAVDSEYEVGKLSQRIRRNKAAQAAAGRPAGREPYGYRRVYDSTTRQSGWRINQVEAKVVREMYTRVAAGESLKAISRDIQARGARSRTGKVFTSQAMRNMLMRESYAGRRVHRPIDGGAATTVKATWPTVVAPAVFDRVRGILTAPERKTRRPGRANHLLSMIAVCDVCSDVLMAAVRRREGADRGWYYRCRGKGCVNVPYDEMNDYAETVMLGYLTRPDVAQALGAAAATGAEVDAARETLAGVERELAELYAEAAAGALSATGAARIEPGLLVRKTTAETRVRELSAPPALAGLLKPGPGAARRWKALPMAAKREVARILLAPDLLGQLRVTRGRKGVQVPVADRVMFSRAEAG